MIEDRIDALIKVYEGYIDENNQSIKKHKNLLIEKLDDRNYGYPKLYVEIIEEYMRENELFEMFIESLKYAKTGEIKRIIKNWKKNLEKKKKKQREDAIKINTFIRLDKSSASEIDKQIEQTYLSLQNNIKFVCTNKDLMNSMLDELDYIVYASKLYGGKHVMEELNQRYRDKLMN